MISKPLRTLAAFALVASQLVASTNPARAQTVGTPEQREQERQRRDQQSDREEVLRVRTNLVELSAVVTDARGRVVENLSKEDFELLENNRPQQINFFTVERVGGSQQQQQAASPGAGVTVPEAATPGAPRQARAPVGRTVVLFVDSLHLTPSGLMGVRKALLRFVDTQMSEGDLVAVVSTGASGGLLGQLTRDRQLLRAAISRLAAQAVQTPSFFTPYLAAQVLRENNDDGEATTLAARVVRAEDGLTATVIDPESNDPDYLQKRYARQKAQLVLAEATQRRRASMAALRAVADHVASLPGQRLVAYFSEGFSMAGSHGEAETADIESVTSRAARSGVVIYAIDARGLSPNPMFDVSAGDFEAGAAQTSQMSAYLASSVTESQNGMNALAKDTGGEPFFNTNDLNKALGRALDENRVYYRIAYHSPEGDDGKFRRVTLRVKSHPDYKVRAQRGYRVEAEAAEAAAQTPRQRLIRAMVSPLPSTALPIEACAGFYAGGADDAQVSFRAHIDGARLDYHEQPDKSGRVDLEIVTVVYDLGGKVVGSFPEPIKMTLAPRGVELAQAYGIDSVKRLSLKPGLYQVRVGVREPSTERVGTSSVVVEVPDLARGKLALSSVFLRADMETTEAAGGAKGATRAAARGEFRQGLQVFRRGEPLVYQFRVYNAGGGGEGALSMRLELRQGERVIYAGAWEPLAPLVVKRDAKGTEVGGQLKAALPPGVYELRVGLRDERRKKTVAGAVGFSVEP